MSVVWTCLGYVVCRVPFQHCRLGQLPGLSTCFSSTLLFCARKLTMAESSRSERAQVWEPTDPCLCCATWGQRTAPLQFCELTHNVSVTLIYLMRLMWGLKPFLGPMNSL